MPSQKLGRVKGKLYLEYNPIIRYLHLDDVRTPTAHWRCIVDLPESNPGAIELGDPIYWIKTYDVPPPEVNEVDVPKGDFRGDYNANEAYAKFDYVLRQGALMRALVDVIAGTPFNELYWEVLRTDLSSGDSFKGEFEDEVDYNANDIVFLAGVLLQAIEDVTAGPHNAVEWDVLNDPSVTKAVPADVPQPEYEVRPITDRSVTVITPSYVPEFSTPQTTYVIDNVEDVGSFTTDSATNLFDIDRPPTPLIASDVRIRDVYHAASGSKSVAIADDGHTDGIPYYRRLTIEDVTQVGNSTTPLLHIDSGYFRDVALVRNAFQDAQVPYVSYFKASSEDASSFIGANLTYHNISSSDLLDDWYYAGSGLILEDFDEVDIVNLAYTDSVGYAVSLKNCGQVNRCTITGLRCNSNYVLLCDGSNVDVLDGSVNGNGGGTGAVHCINGGHVVFNNFSVSANTAELIKVSDPATIDGVLKPSIVEIHNSVLSHTGPLSKMVTVAPGCRLVVKNVIVNGVLYEDEVIEGHAEWHPDSQFITSHKMIQSPLTPPTFEDLFVVDGDVDPAKWNVLLGHHEHDDAQTFLNNPNNVIIEGGRLNLIARSGEDFNDATISSGAITTKGKLAWDSGRFDVVCGLPRGDGLVPFIELSGVESPGRELPNSGIITPMRVDCGNPFVNIAGLETGHAGVGESLIHSAMTDPLVKLSVIWAPDKLEYLINDSLMMTINKPTDAHDGVWPFDNTNFEFRDFYLTIGLMVKDASDVSIFPCKLVVESVRVYPI